jgi:hypothetical protein
MVALKAQRAVPNWSGEYPSPASRSSRAQKYPSPNRHTFVAGLKLCDEFARAMMPP